MRLILASLLFVTACAGTATYSATGTYSSPDLVEVDSGVQVIADYDEPVFYSENYYWRNNGGRWYRSSYHDRGWVVYEAPERVRTVSVRANYRHYKPAGYQPRASRPAKGYQPQPSNKGYQPRPSDKGYQPQPSNDRHDNRDHDKHDDKRDHDKRDKDDKHDKHDKHD